MEYNIDFNEYVEMIVEDPHYAGLYYNRNEDGKVNWVVTGKSAKGQERKKWWDEKCHDLNIPIQNGCYAKAARLIHPTGYHTCQTCGKKVSIYYEYPTLTTIKKLSALIKQDIKQTDYTIKEIVEKFCYTQKDLDYIADTFALPRQTDKGKLIESIYSELVQKESDFFSPGVMSNSPDRFDGFHSYNLCCRKTKDKGRNDINMKTYAQDRRAYEEWSDGNWELANRLMGEFAKADEIVCPMCKKIDKMTADHIGPISLGFCHDKNFTPLCRSCNSSKNNRFTKHDVDTLIERERNGIQVISWHSKYIWDLLKHKIQNDTEAQKASSTMAKCHQNILYTFALIYKQTGESFLSRYLHPDYAMFDYRFENLDLTDLSKLKIIKTPLDSKNKRKKQERYLRIAFESLEDFEKKDNRKNELLLNEQSQEIINIVSAIKDERFDDADSLLKDTLNEISIKIYEKEWTTPYPLFPE